MHHQPAITMKRTANYVDKRSMKNMHYDIYTSLPKQLDKYYKSAAEAYLAMKVFDLLDDNYTAKR
jgi:hypothetical protein